MIRKEVSVRMSVHPTGFGSRGQPPASLQAYVAGSGDMRRSSQTKETKETKEPRNTDIRNSGLRSARGIQALRGFDSETPRTGAEPGEGRDRADGDRATGRRIDLRL